MMIFNSVFDNNVAFLPFALNDYVMGDWILKDDTYFTRNVSILSGDPIPFSSTFDLCKFGFIYNFYDVFFSVYTHMDQIYKKGGLKDGQSILFCIQITAKSAVYLSQLQ
jgi:hypothetical protein